MKARSPKGFSLPGLAFLLGKSVHVLCLFLASDVLHSGSLPIITYTFLLLSGSAFLFLLIQRAYSLFPVLSRPQLTALVTNGLFLASSLLLSSFGLKHCGPIRTLLLDFADHLLLFLPVLLCSFSTLTSNRRKGLSFIALAVLILLLTPEVSVHDAPDPNAIGSVSRAGSRFKIAGMVQAGVGGEQEDFGEVAQIAPAKEPGAVGVSGERLVNGEGVRDSGHSFSFLWLQLSESSVGMLSLILASSISFLRKNYEKRHAKEFGGRKRFHAVSCCAGAALLFPFMVIQLLFFSSSPTTSASSAHSLGLLSILATLFFLILFLVVLQFYVDSIAQRSDIQLLTKLNLVISLLCAAAIDWYREEQRLSLSTLVSSVSIFFGVHYLLSSSSPSSSSSSAQEMSTTLPVYTPTAKPTSAMRSLRLMLKHFLTDPTSLRIFSFLCINFCFMFVELLYGYFSNSLGLISDAGHMLFDCVPAGTRVSLADGTSLPIEKVPVGARVLSRRAAEAPDEEDGLVPMAVAAVMDRGVRPCVELLFSDGRTLTCTAKHRILTATGVWMEAQQLVVGVTEVAVGVDHPVVDRDARSQSAPPTPQQNVSMVDTDDDDDDGDDDGGDGSRSDDDAGTQSPDRVTYSAHRDGEALPLSRVKLVGRRAVESQRVYDLCVPNPQGEDSCSFVANGVLVHNCTALAIGLYASYISKVKANSVYTYGYGRYEILSGYVNGVFLLFIGYFILVESVERLFTPPEIRGESLVVVSGLGLCVNLIGLFFFHDHHGGHGHSHGGGGGDHGHSHGGASAEVCDDDSHEGHDHGHSGHGGHDTDDHGHAHDHHGHSHAPVKAEKDSGHVNHNILAIYLHILADTLGSVGVIISSLLIQFYHFTSADAICSIIISLLIIGSTGPLLTSTLHILLTRTPARKEKAIQSALSAIQAMPGVTSVRSTHFWLFSDSELVGTLVVGVEGGVDEQAVLVKVSELLKGKRVGVNNLTVQVERDGIGSGAGLLKGLGNGTNALSS